MHLPTTTIFLHNVCSKCGYWVLSPHISPLLLSAGVLNQLHIASPHVYSKPHAIVSLCIRALSYTTSNLKMHFWISKPAWAKLIKVSLHHPTFVRPYIVWHNPTTNLLIQVHILKHISIPHGLLCCTTVK